MLVCNANASGFSSHCNIDLGPGAVGRERIYLAHKLCRIWPEILLKYRTIMIDHEGHDTRIAVFGWIGEERETADHLALDEVVISAAGSG